LEIVSTPDASSARILFGQADITSGLMDVMVNGCLLELTNFGDDTNARCPYRYSWKCITDSPL